MKSVDIRYWCHCALLNYVIKFYFNMQNPDNIVFVMDATIGQACEAQVRTVNYYTCQCSKVVQKVPSFHGLS